MSNITKLPIYTKVVQLDPNAPGGAAVEVVPIGNAFYGFVIEWVRVPGIILQFGSASTGPQFTIKSGAVMVFPNAETGGLYAFAPTGLTGSVAIAKVTVFTHPVTKADFFGDMWDKASGFFVEGEQTASGGNYAAVGVDVVAPSVQTLAPYSFATAFAERMARIDSLLIESSATGRVLVLAEQIASTMQGFGVIPTKLTLTDIPFYLVTPGGVTAFKGQYSAAQRAIAVAIGPVIAHPTVTAGEDTGLSDMGQDVTSGRGLSVIDDTAGTTLYVAMQMRVARFFPEQP